MTPGSSRDRSDLMSYRGGSESLSSGIEKINEHGREVGVVGWR